MGRKRTTQEALKRADEIRAGLHQFMKVRRLKVTPWCDKAGVSEGALRNFLKGRSSTMNNETLERLADAAGVMVEFMLAGAPGGDFEMPDNADEMYESIKASAIYEAVETLRNWGYDLPEDLDAFDFKKAKERGGPVQPGAKDLPVRGQMIKEFDLKGGMGNGEILAQEHHATVWHVPDGYFGSGDLVIMDSKGDSNAPTLLSRDRLVVCLTDRDASQGGFFAINDGWGVKVKRIETIAQSKPRKIRILSENPLYPPDELVIEENTIVGRVVGLIRRF